MELPELLDTTTLQDFLRQSLSLESEDSLENDLDVGVNAAQMLKYFDNYNILDGAPDAVGSNNLTEGGALMPTILNNLPSIRTASTEARSKAPENTFERKKPHKHSRRVQIIALRELVKTLTCQLKALQTDSSLEMHEPVQLRQSQLKHVALRQYQRRRNAEDDNARLREVFEMQVQEAKCLQRILKRRAKIQMLEDMLAMKHHKDAHKFSAPADNSQIFTKMLHELDQNYQHVDHTFADKGINALPCPGRKRKICPSTITGVVLEVLQRHMLPFSLHKAKKCARAILKGLGTSALQRIQDFNKLTNFHAQFSEESRDTICTSYFSATPGVEVIGGAQIRKVMRVYVEQDRIVLLWKMLAEPKLAGSNAPAGYQVESTLQVVLQPDEIPTLDGGHSTHLFIHFSGFRRDLEIPVSSTFRELGHNEISIAMWEKLLLRIPSEIESELIDSNCRAVSEIPQLQEGSMVST